MPTLFSPTAPVATMATSTTQEGGVDVETSQDVVQSPDDKDEDDKGPTGTNSTETKQEDSPSKIITTELDQASEVGKKNHVQSELAGGENFFDAEASQEVFQSPDDKYKDDQAPTGTKNAVAGKDHSPSKKTATELDQASTEGNENDVEAELAEAAHFVDVEISQEVAQSPDDKNIDDKAPTESNNAEAKKEDSPSEQEVKEVDHARDADEKNDVKAEQAEADNSLDVETSHEHAQSLDDKNKDDQAPKGENSVEAKKEGSLKEGVNELDQASGAEKENYIQAVPAEAENVSDVEISREVTKSPNVMVEDDMALTGKNNVEAKTDSPNKQEMNDVQAMSAEGENFLDLETTHEDVLPDDTDEDNMAPMEISDTEVKTEDSPSKEEAKDQASDAEKKSDIQAMPTRGKNFLDVETTHEDVLPDAMDEDDKAPMGVCDKEVKTEDSPIKEEVKEPVQATDKEKENDVQPEPAEAENFLDVEVARSPYVKDEDDKAPTGTKNPEASTEDSTSERDMKEFDRARDAAEENCVISERAGSEKFLDVEISREFAQSPNANDKDDQAPTETTNTVATKEDSPSKQEAKQMDQVSETEEKSVEKREWAEAENHAATVPRVDSPAKDVVETAKKVDKQDENNLINDTPNVTIKGGTAVPPLPKSSPAPSSPEKKVPIVNVDSPDDKTSNRETRIGPPRPSVVDPLISPTAYHRKFCLHRRKRNSNNKKQKHDRSKTHENVVPRSPSLSCPPLNETTMAGESNMNGGMMGMPTIGPRKEEMMNRMAMSGFGIGGGGGTSRLDAQDVRTGGGRPGNLQELREMMGGDMERMGSRGGAAGSIVNKDMRGSTNYTEGSKIMHRQGGRGSPSHFDEDMLSYPGIGTMREPMLPTPADAKPSFKQSYKDISFSPLDRLDRGLMQRIMAFQDNTDPNANAMGMSGLPPLPNGGMGMAGMPLTTDSIKRKFSDFAYSPRSPNPKKSFLERHRMMDKEMKGHLEEAMASFGRFQKKYSGNGPSGDMSMMGGNDPAMMGNDSLQQDSFVLTGASLDENPSKKRKNESKSNGKSNEKKKRKKATKDKKVKEKKKSGSKGPKNTKDGTKEDQSRPKRPFSAYNLFFQLEREAIILAAAEGKDPLDDELEKEYHEKKKSDDNHIKENASAKKERPPLDPNIHEPIDPDAPERYRNLRLEKLWYRAGCKTKRRHRKSEGSVGFLELTKMISRRWANIEELAPEVKKYCQKLAQQELELYKKQLEKYKAALKEEKKNAKNKLQSDDSDGSDDSDDSEEQDSGEDEEPNPPKGKSSKKTEKALLPGVNEQGSQTPRADREALFDPQFSSRFTDLSKMSLFFPQGTPKDMHTNPSMLPTGGGGSTVLPPPPFVDKCNVPNSDIERQMAAVINAERRLANMAGGPGGGLRSLGAGGDGMSDRAAAFADARYRMQMEMQMQGGIMGGGPMGDFSSRGMSGGFGGMFSGGMSERSQFSNMQRSMMMNQDFFPSGGGGLGGGMMNSQMMRNRFLERFGNNPDNLPRNEDEFDMEVERFLSCLGKEIKENHRRRSVGMGDASGGGGTGMGGPMYGDRMMNRMMMMDQMLMRNDGGGVGLGSGNNMNYSQMRDFRRQMGSDDPHLPEFQWGHGGPNSNGARC